MFDTIRTSGLTIMLALTVTAPSDAQQEQRPDPGILATQMASGMLKIWVTTAAEMMDEADYAFRPTPDVRSFGELVAHIADVDYEFCAAAKRETPPRRDLAKTLTTRSEIRTALTEAFAYCDAAYADITGAAANAMVELRGNPLPALAVLIFRTNHASLHYGNIVTYMRLRGKVPPSSAMSSAR